jgi:hypothetical protein
VSDTEDKPPITVLYSIGLMNRVNSEVFSELGQELTQSGYPAEVDVRPPSGQFSALASLEQILIVVGGFAATGAAVFSKKYLELAAEYAWKRTEMKLPRLKPRKPESEKLAIVVTVEIDGTQIKNVLYRGPDDIKELPTQPDRPHGHIIEPSDDGGVTIKRSDASGEQRWTPLQ